MRVVFRLPFKYSTTHEGTRFSQTQNIVTLSFREYSIVQLREIGTELIGTILEFASIPPIKIGTHWLGFCWPVSVSYFYIDPYKVSTASRAGERKEEHHERIGTSYA